MFSNSAGFQHVPTRQFQNACSAPKDHNRIEMMRDKGIIYYPNGGGRDTYIYNDNGGFASMKQPRNQFHPGGFLPGQEHSKYFSKQKHPHLHSKPINYNQDGTGRDTYIIIGNGGLSPSPHPKKEFRHAFKDSLRGWNKIPFYLEQRGKGANSNGFRKTAAQTGKEDFGETNFSPLNLTAYMSPSKSKIDKYREEANKTQCIDNLNPEMDDENNVMYKTQTDPRGQVKLSNQSKLATTGLNAVQTIDPQGSRTLKNRNRRDQYNKQDETAANMALLLDNPNCTNINDISRYIKKLDDRLSVPKFNKHEDPQLSRTTSSRRDLILAKRQSTQQTSLSPDMRFQGVSQRNFLGRTRMLSQDERDKLRKRKYRQGESHHLVTVENRNEMFDAITKGKNECGGTYGGGPGEAYDRSSPSPKKFDSGQKYNHCQKDPIIIRGGANVDPNHLVMRNYSLM